MPAYNDAVSEAAARSFDALVALHRPRIFRFALASLRDPDAAGTVTQDCFLKAYRAQDRFRRECSMETWLMQIAVNLIRDYARNRKLQFWRRTRETESAADILANHCDERGRSPEALALMKERVGAVWEAAAKLPGKQKAVFLLRFVEDLDLLEIAEVMKMKEGTVKAHLFRALKAVRARMGETQ